MKTTSFLRDGTARRILSILLDERTLFHKDLASRLGISSQALTWQINRLRRIGLVDSTTDGIRKRYLLAEERIAMVKRSLNLVS